MYRFIQTVWHDDEVYNEGTTDELAGWLKAHIKSAVACGLIEQVADDIQPPQEVIDGKGRST